MAYAARYVFQAAYDAHRELTELFDFVAPTAIALWNLRWQVQGFLKEVPNATSNDLSNRFAFGSGMRGGELRRACIDTPWINQLEKFAELVLINVIASFENFTYLAWRWWRTAKNSCSGAVRESYSKDTLDPGLRSLVRQSCLVPIIGGQELETSPRLC
jgi:hypothetical protein